MHIVFKYLYAFFFKVYHLLKVKRLILKNTHLIFFDIIFAEYLEIFSIFEKITKKMRNKRNKNPQGK